MHKRLTANTLFLLLLSVFIVFGSCQKIDDYKDNPIPTRDPGGNTNNSNCKLLNISTNDTSFNLTIFYTSGQISSEVYIENNDTVIASYTNFNEISRTHSINGVIDVITLNTFGLPYQMVRRSGLVPIDTTSYIYDSNNNLNREVTKNHEITYSYSTANNLLNKRVKNKKYGIDTLVVDYTYNTEAAPTNNKLLNYILRGPIVGKIASNLFKKITSHTTSKTVSGDFVTTTTYIDFTYDRKDGALYAVKTITTSDKPIANTNYILAYDCN